MDCAAICLHLYGYVTVVLCDLPSYVCRVPTAPPSSIKNGGCQILYTLRHEYEVPLWDADVVVLLVFSLHTDNVFQSSGEYSGGGKAGSGGGGHAAYCLLPSISIVNAKRCSYYCSIQYHGSQVWFPLSIVAISKTKYWFVFKYDLGRAWGRVCCRFTVAIRRLLYLRYLV